MIDRLREFFKSPAGMAIAAVLVAIGLFFAVGAIRGFITTEAESLSSDRMFVDVKTNEPFSMDLEVGMKIPVKAPSGGETGYPAEICEWNKDGSKRSEPFYVALNTWQGKK